MARSRKAIVHVTDALVDPDDLNLERRAHFGRLSVPPFVALESGKLVYAAYEFGPSEAREIVARGELAGLSDWERDKQRERMPPRLVRPSEGVLERFLELAEAPDKRILNFAHRFGPLLICRHGVPSGHRPYPAHFYLKELESHCHPLGWAGRSGWEPTEAWRRLSRLARALLTVRAQLQQDGPVKRSFWEEEILSRTWGYRVAPGVTAASQSFALARQIGLWLETGQVTPWLGTRAGRFYVRVGGRTVFAALAYQLMLVVAQSKAHVKCSACPRIFPPSRRPRAGERSYCPTCKGKNRHIRDAETDYRARKLRALELHATGITAKQIAVDVGSNAKTVAGWIRAARK